MYTKKWIWRGSWSGMNLKLSPTFNTEIQPRLVGSQNSRYKSLKYGSSSTKSANLGRVLFMSIPNHHKTRPYGPHACI